MKKTRRTTETPAQQAPAAGQDAGFCEIDSHGADDLAVISRTMGDGWREDPDPLVHVSFHHVETRTDPLTGLRLSALELLIADIASAIATGRKLGALPPAQRAKAG
jgi:hypothetical protein